MGLRNGSAVGEMVDDGGPNFANECFKFFERQCELVDPDLVVLCGDEVEKVLSGWEGDPRCASRIRPATGTRNHRERRAAKWARNIKEALARVVDNGSARTSSNQSKAAGQG